MPCELLVRAEGDHKGPKGMIQTIHRDGRAWGQKERMPRYVQIRVTDAEYDEIAPRLEPVILKFDYELVAQNAQGRRYKIFFDSRLAKLGGFDNRFTRRARQFLESEYGAILVGADTSNLEVTLDIPNTDWSRLRERVADILDNQLTKRRYYVDPSDVDIIISAGGRVELTKAQLANRIRDRLDD